MCLRRNGEEKLQVHKNTPPPQKKKEQQQRVNLLESCFEQMVLRAFLKQSTLEI